jgi:2'-5' RNA ligase
VDDFFGAVDQDWPAGRDDYHWQVLPGRELSGDRILRPYRPLIEQPGLAAVRPAALHLTIQHLAPVADLDDGDLNRIVRLVRDRCSSQSSFSVTVGRAEAWDHGIVCPVRPADQLARLWQITTSAGQEATGDRFAIHPAEFYPHLALAYATSHVDKDITRAWLAACAASEIDMPVTKLVLVAQRHDRREITFRIVTEVPLAGVPLAR